VSIRGPTYVAPGTRHLLKEVVGPGVVGSIGNELVQVGISVADWLRVLDLVLWSEQVYPAYQ
jgi:hypothetical protein